MIRLEARSISSPDVEVGVWSPAADGKVCILLELEIGEAGDERCDLFQIMVLTPEGLLDLPGRPVILDRAGLVLSEFSWPSVIEILEGLVQRCAGRDWNESVLRLQRHFRWEYED